MRRTFDNRLMRWTWRFGRARDGAAAVEFAMIAAPFLALLFGVLELGLIYVMSSALDNSMVEVSRTIRTGEIKSLGLENAGDFQTRICKEMGWAGPNCSQNLAIRVEAITDYKIPPKPTPLFDEKGQAQSNFQATGEGQIVLVRAGYKWSVITPMLGHALANSPDGTRVITSTLVFRNEPFGS